MKYDFHADPVLGSAFSYWNQRRGERSLPSRSDIVPADILKLLPHITLVDVVDSGARFRYRLAGTAVVDAYGIEITGKYVDEHLTGNRSRFVHDYYRAVCQTRRPAFVRTAYITSQKIPMIAKRLLLPLAEDGAEIGIIMGAVSFQSTNMMLEPLEFGADIDSAESYFEFIPYDGWHLAMHFDLSKTETPS